MMMHPKRARVRATLRRRGSERKPMPWCSFDLTSVRYNSVERTAVKSPASLSKFRVSHIAFTLILSASRHGFIPTPPNPITLKQRFHFCIACFPV